MKKLFLQPWQRVLWNLLFAVLGGTLLIFSTLVVSTQGIFSAFAQVAQHPVAFLWNILFLAVLSLFFGLLTKRLAWGYLLVSLVVVILNLVNYFKTLITSMPLELPDLKLVGQVGAIADLNAEAITFSAATIFGILLPLAWFVVLCIFAKPVLDVSWKWSLSGACGSLIVFLLCFVLFAGSLVYSPLKAPLDAQTAQAIVYRDCLFPLGMWRSVLYRGSAVDVDISDKDAMEEMMENMNQGLTQKDPQPSPETTPGAPPSPEGTLSPDPNPAPSLTPDPEVSPPAAEDVQPNIILILSESFFDVTTLPGITFETDPLAEYHALQAESVSGKFYSRTMGYGTCNIELEILTGINSRLLANGDDPLHWAPADQAMFPTVPYLLKQAGYYTGFLHMFNDTIYNRKSLFSHLSFDDMFFNTDYAAIDPDAAAASDLSAYLFGKRSGTQLGDAYMTDLIINLYEQKEATGPVFLYASSMENHSPYNADKYRSYHYPFTSKTQLTDAAIGTLNAYVEGVSNSSKALKRLTDYFSQVDEPTVILFYGDHVPGLGLDTGSVYNQLWNYTGSIYNTNPDTGAEIYSSEYLIWANDPSLLPGPAGSRTDTSCAYFGLEVLEAAEIPLPRYWLLVNEMRRESQAYNQVYFVSNDGKASWTMPDTVNKEPFTQMAAALADAKSERFLTDWLWEIPS